MIRIPAISKLYDEYFMEQIGTSSEYKAMLHEYISLKEELLAQLQTQDIKDKVLNLCQVLQNMNEDYNRYAFAKGFSVGMQITTEALYKNEEKERR